MGKGLKKKEPTETDPIIPQEEKKDESDAAVSTRQQLAINYGIIDINNSL